MVLVRHTSPELERVRSGLPSVAADVLHAVHSRTAIASIPAKIVAILVAQARACGHSICMTKMTSKELSVLVGNAFANKLIKGQKLSPVEQKVWTRINNALEIEASIAALVAAESK